MAGEWQRARTYEDGLRQLMVRYQSADPAAIKELVRLLSPGLLRFLSSPRLSESDAADLLQTAGYSIRRALPETPILQQSRWRSIHCAAARAKRAGYHSASSTNSSPPRRRASFCAS